MSELLRRGLKLTHLRLMQALGDTGQLGAAADRIGIAQPAASRLLAEVERIVGRPVHERTGRGVALTEVGTALSRRAARVLTELADAGRELDEIAGGAAGRVRIGSVTGPALDRVLPALRAARLALPGVTAEVTVAPSDLLNTQLLDGRLDFAIGRLPSDETRHLLETRLIEAEPVELMVRRGHRLAEAPVRAEDLMAYDWVMPGTDAILWRAVTARLHALGLPNPPQRLSTASFLLTLAMVQHSNAVAPLARAVADTFARGAGAPFAVVPIDLGIEVEPFGLVTRADTTLPPAARRLAEMILANSAAAPGE
ncbi:MAG: LysR substrate-binding domain-containing protein [Paracoccaceae bacterium]